MNGIQMMSGFLTMVMYGIILCGVFKLFAIGNDLGEIKELLKKRAEPPSPWADNYADRPAKVWSVVDPDR